jgi:Lon-like protease
MLSMSTRALVASRKFPSLRIMVAGTRLSFGLSWLIVAPVGLWVIASAYVGVLGAFLTPAATWAVALLTAVLVVLSLAVHALAHALAGRAFKSAQPSRVPLYPLGDAAQVWPAASSAGREALCALAGPVAGWLLAAVGFALWNAQLHPYLNVSMPFFCAFNLGLGILNLIPAFPFDGGRLARAIDWGLLDRSPRSPRSTVGPGLVLAVALAGWGIFLLLQGARFSLETGLATLALAALIVLALFGGPVWPWDRTLPPHRVAPAARAGRAVAAGPLLLVLLALPAMLLPTNQGLEAPGLALAVEPMIEVPPEHFHQPAGSFILTSVLQQAPIILGEQAYARLDGRVRIMPAEQIVPANTTLQEQARQGYQMMDESTVTASVVALHLAGFPAQAEGKGARVDSVLPNSPSRQLLAAGDVITSVAGSPVRTTSDLTRLVAAQPAGGTVRLEFLREGQPMTVEAPLMSPAALGGPPRLGIAIESAGMTYSLPFPVKIVPQKIVGGPSAGLMFTLTLYNLLTPGDLTGGRKIAGTGTISLDGTVGPIGGVEQKVAAAELAGAEYFLSPPENYAAAAGAAHKIKVVEVATAEQAIEFLNSLSSTPAG